MVLIILLMPKHNYQPMNQQQIIHNTITFVKHKLHNAEGGHDWFHIERVWKNANLIAASEENANLFIIELGALLHDIADSKFQTVMIP